MKVTTRRHPAGTFPEARVPTLNEALRAALFTERHSGQAVVVHPHAKVRTAMLREGLVSEYWITDTPGAQVFLVLTDAGRKRAAGAS